MALAHSPRIVTDGLVLCLDAANPKSFSGKENLFLNSNDFTTNTWIYQQNPNTLATTINATVDPFGEFTATKLYISNSGTFYSAYRSYVIAANINYSYSIFLKAAEVTTASLTIHTGVNNSININLTTGEILSTSILDTNFTLNSSTTTFIQDGWYRIQFNFAHSVGGNYQFKVDLLNNTNIGNGYFVYGAQLEKNKVATNYTPTSSSAIQRSTTWVDLSGNGNNGTLTNGPTFTNGNLVFDGVNDYVVIPHSTILAPTNQITLSSWVTTDWQTTKNVRILSKTEGGGWQLSINDDPSGNKVGMTIHIAGSYRYVTVDKTTISPGYHNIVGTFDGRYAKLYIDSTMVVNNDLGSTLSLTYSYNNSLIIGAEAGVSGPANTNFINANIPQILIYNRSLASQEIQQNFNALRGRYGI